MANGENASKKEILLRAIENNDLKSVKIMLDNIISINQLMGYNESLMTRVKGSEMRDLIYSSGKYTLDYADIEDALKSPDQEKLKFIFEPFSITDIKKINKNFIYMAVKYGTIEDLKYLVNIGFSIQKVRDKKNLSTLQHAVNAENIEAIMYLIQNFAVDLEDKESFGKIIAFGNKELTTTALKHGLKAISSYGLYGLFENIEYLDFITKSGLIEKKEFIHIIVRQAKLQQIRDIEENYNFLKEYSAEELLIDGFRNGNEGVFEYILNKYSNKIIDWDFVVSSIVYSSDLNAFTKLKATINEISDLRKRKIATTKALLSKISFHNTPIMDFLLEVGVEIDPMAKEINSKLIIKSLEFKRYDLIKLLISKGAKLQDKDYLESRYFINKALIDLDPKLIVINEFLKWKLVKKSDLAQLLFAWSLKKEDIDLLNMALKKGLQVNVPNINNQTPLELAVKAKKIMFIQALLAAGASPNAYSRNGSPWEIALRSKNTKIIDELKKAGGKTVVFKNAHKNRRNIKAFIKPTTSYKLLKQKWSNRTRKELNEAVCKKPGFIISYRKSLNGIVCANLGYETHHHYFDNAYDAVAYYRFGIIPYNLAMSPSYSYEETRYFQAEYYLSKKDYGYNNRLVALLINIDKALKSSIINSETLKQIREQYNEIFKDKIPNWKIIK